MRKSIKRTLLGVGILYAGGVLIGAVDYTIHDLSRQHAAAAAAHFSVGYDYREDAGRVCATSAALAGDDPHAICAELVAGAALEVLAKDDAGLIKVKILMEPGNPMDSYVGWADPTRLALTPAFGSAEAMLGQR